MHARTPCSAPGRIVHGDSARPLNSMPPQMHTTRRRRCAACGSVESMQCPAGSPENGCWLLQNRTRLRQALCRDKSSTAQHMDRGMTRQLRKPGACRNPAHRWHVHSTDSLLQQVTMSARSRALLQRPSCCLRSLLGCLPAQQPLRQRARRRRHRCCRSGRPRASWRRRHGRTQPRRAARPPPPGCWRCC